MVSRDDLIGSCHFGLLHEVKETSLSSTPIELRYGNSICSLERDTMRLDEIATLA